MKKYAKLLIALGIGLTIAGYLLLNSKKPNPEPTPTPSVVVDTTKYTDVVLINKSNLDSVQVFVTLQSGYSIIGKFGMDSSNIFTKCMYINGNDTTYNPCVGTFWAKKDSVYHWGDTNTVGGVIVTWGVQNQACTAAQSILDSKGKQIYPFGINNFEFNINTWWQNGKVTGANESADITCVDGLHSVLKMSVTSFGPRSETPKSTNFDVFWDYGVDSLGSLIPFKSSMNGITFDGCVNIPGVYPYGCDLGYKSQKPPTPCTNPSYPITCSDKWGQGVNASQLNRQGQGGYIICEFLGYTKDAVPAEK